MVEQYSKIGVSADNCGGDIAFLFGMMQSKMFMRV